MIFSLNLKFDFFSQKSQSFYLVSLSSLTFFSSFFFAIFAYPKKIYAFSSDLKKNIFAVIVSPREFDISFLGQFDISFLSHGSLIMGLSG